MPKRATTIDRYGGETFFRNKTGWGTLKSFDAVNRIATIEWATELKDESGRRGIRKKTFKTKGARVDEFGNLVSMGSRIKDTTFKIGKDTWYRFNGISRLDNGFSTLISELEFSGVSEEELFELTNMWDNLSTAQKIRFFNSYRQSSIVKLYGSDAINENLYDSGMDSMDYYDLIHDILIDVRMV